MKLNPDCIRDILLEVESHTHFNSALVIDVDKPNALFESYSWDEIAYHINQCALSDLITGTQIFYDDGYAVIKDLSPDGHTFIANIRSKTHWAAIKKIASTVGSFALPVLQQIATTYIQGRLPSNPV